MAVERMSQPKLRPRRLRLDAMLRDLGARTAEDDLTPDPATPASWPEGSAAMRPDAVTVGDLVDKTTDAGFGFLIGVLALIAIPFFGLSTPFGLAIALGGGQLAVGRARPWLPARMRKRRLSMSMLDRVLGLLARRTKWLTSSTKHRWQRLIMPKLVGFAIALLGIGLALPLPIPGSNMIFIIPILVYAVGLLERDGLWIAIAHVCTLIDLALVIAFGATVVAVLERVWSWIF
ncbi:MAG: exopolysaccharide biosynthesis protein [Kofleriaceae bacterium]|nr:exopolysaccharide biosynthesis protein [Kofleriaceae bacterium]